MNNLEIKQKVLEYLKIHGCALLSQLMEPFEFEDSRYLTNNLMELIERNKVRKILYRRFHFYIISGNEGEVKRKIRLIKKYIKEIIREFGPIRAKFLVKKIRNIYNSLANLYTINELT
jgi:hypothetical protein